MGNTQLTWQNPVAAGDEPVGDPCGESKHGTSSMCDDADGNQFLVNTNNAPAESEPKQYNSPSITQSESNKLSLLSADQDNEFMTDLSVHPDLAGQAFNPGEANYVIEDKEREAMRVAALANPLLAQHMHRIVGGDLTAALSCSVDKLPLYVNLPIFACGLPVLETDNCGIYKPPIIKAKESRKLGGDAYYWYQQMMLFEWDGLLESYKKAQAEYKILDRNRIKNDNKNKKADAARKKKAELERDKYDNDNKNKKADAARKRRLN